MSQYQKIVVTGCAIYDGKVLLVQRSPNEVFHPEKYEMPGGKVDFGEDPKEALAREYMEETGLEIKVGEPFYTFAYISDEGKRHTVEIIYKVEILSDPMQIQLSPKDHIAYVRANPAEIENYLDDPQDEIYKAAKLATKEL